MTVQDAVVAGGVSGCAADAAAGVSVVASSGAAAADETARIMEVAIVDDKLEKTDVVALETISSFP